MTGIVLHLCAPCLSARVPAAVATVERAFDEAGIPVQVRACPCLGPCDRPVALALQGAGATYVFAGVRLPDDLDDLIATCRTYAGSPGGWIEDARPCGRLRFCLRTRIPAPG